MRVWLIGDALMAACRVAVLGVLAKLYLTVPAALATTINPFQNTYVELTPPTEIYDEGACFTSLVVPLDLNYDGRQDLLVHYFCNDFNGEVAPEPTLNALMVYISESDGTFNVGNKDIFGADKISLGGATRNYARGDFNNDGKPDIVFAVNWEDGRPQESQDSWATEQTAILSGPTGYAIQRVGEAVWGHGVSRVQNKLGYDDILTYRPSKYGGNEIAFLRIEDGITRYVEGDYPDRVWPGLTVGTVPAEENLGRQNFFVESPAGGFTYYVKDANKWITYEQGGIERTSVESATWVSWVGEDSPLKVTQIDGSYFANGGIVDSCYVAKTDDFPGYIIGKFATWYLGETLDEAGTYYEMEQPVVNKLVFFEVLDDGIKLVPTLLGTEYPADFFNFLTCKDINNDGLTDIAVHNQTGNVAQGDHPFSGGAPRTYIRKSDGTFAVLDTSAFPKGEERGTQLGAYADINGDELEDLILYNTDGNIPVRVHIAETVMTLPSSQTTYKSLLKTLQRTKSSSVVKTAGANPGADAAQIFYDQDADLESVSSIDAGAETPVRARAISSSSSAVEAIPTLPISGIGLLALFFGIFGSRVIQKRRDV